MFCLFWLLLLYYCYLPHTSLNQTSSMMGGYVHFDILARPSTDFNSNYIILEFHVQLRFIELKMNYRLVVEIGAGCLCRWADLLCTIASWCQQRNFIFILCTFVLHWLSNLNHTKIIYLMCSHICLYIGRFFGLGIFSYSHTQNNKIEPHQQLTKLRFKLSSLISIILATY